MQQLDENIVVSPTDLTRYAACRHLSALDLAVARGYLEPPEAGVDETLQRLFERGLEHERAYLQRLRDRGLDVVEVPFEHSGAAALHAAERLTEDAMASGADVVYQGTFFDGRWRGHADFLLRRDDRPGRWPWSYDVADTKLARKVKVAALLQMAVYADRLTALQGVEPEQLVVVTGNGQERPFPFADCAAYARHVRAELLGFIGTQDGVPREAPEPVPHCPHCRWRPRCRAQWRREDHLSLVAFMRRDHARALSGAGVSTVAQLASRSPEELPNTIGLPSRERLTAQARLQLEERTTGLPRYELLPPELGRGLALLPDPSPGDVFFDIEGDPFSGEDGLEYLFGVVQQGTFTPVWATAPSQERAAFEALVDLLIDAWDRDPGMHVYHYAPYEPTRLKALAGRYGTRQAELDRLLRGERLVDLYTVVRQGLRVSKESYSIKQLEHFTWGEIRPHEGVADALGSVVAFERWLDSGDQALLDDIARYNEDDCRSTEALRDWLEQLRLEGGGDDVYSRPEHSDGSPSEAVKEAQAEVDRLTAALLDGVPDVGADEAQGARRLLAGLLDWHRREALPEWWAWYARQRMTDEELVRDSAAIGEVSGPVDDGPDKRSVRWRMTFPPQDTKLSPGDKAFDPRTGKRVGDILDIDAEQGWLVLKRGAPAGPPAAPSLVPESPRPDTDQRNRLLELARWVLDNGIDGAQPEWRAARDLLLRRAPRLQTVGAAGATLQLPGEPGEAALARLATALDGGVLPVQGPPGTGKTWAGARMVLRLLADGKRVGVAAFSHKAIGNLLDAVVEAAGEQGTTIRALQKSSEAQRCASTSVACTGDPKVVEAALAAGDVDLVAGTSWLYAREQMQDALDVLVVDEAGQLSLANVLAISGAARSVVLLGDPQQLAQPVKGQHPPGAEASALEHLIGDHATVPPDRGLLLDTTWRMHPEVASFVSRTSYDGRLRVAQGCEGQEVRSASPLVGTGLRFVPVEHADDAAASTAEAEVVRSLVEDLLADGSWTDRTGSTRRLTAGDVLVLAPYNAHVNRLRSRMPALIERGLRIGTVDKYQGQEAPVVLCSLASSTVEDAPRGMEFLYDLHRLNVALSRARCVAAIVCSPALLAPEVRTPQQLRLANVLCAFVDEASTVRP